MNEFSAAHQPLLLQQISNVIPGTLDIANLTRNPV
jgi:hypothetical protein